MKRYTMRDVTPYVTVHPDGEWVRYEDHVAALAQQPQGEAQKYCSDERPCINCFADNGQCLDAPVAQGLPDLTDERIAIFLGRFVDPWMHQGAEAQLRAILAQSAPRADHAGEDAAPSASAGQAELSPVDRDVLPAVGTDVLIHLARQDEWVPHKVVGYYVWPDLKGNPFLQRVNVRVQDRDGYLNARMLRDVRRVDGTPFVIDKRAAPAPSASPETMVHYGGGETPISFEDGASPAALTGIPAGWTFDRLASGAILIGAPTLSERVARVVDLSSRSHGDRLLFCLADALLAQPPAADEADKRDAERWRLAAATWKVLRVEVVPGVVLSHAKGIPFEDLVVQIDAAMSASKDGESNV